MINKNSESGKILEAGICASLQECNHTKSPIKNNTLSMSKIIQILKSRTAWTVVALFLFNGVTAIQNLLPIEFAPLVNGLLSILAIYFKVFPSQSYK